MFAKPQVGERILVTTRFTNHLYGARNPFKDDVYVGRVERDFKWLTPTQFVLSTPEDSEMPVRVIDLAYVVDLKGADGSAAKSQAVGQKRVVNITGSKGDVYTVVIEAGKASCSCSGFQFRRTCKHVKEAV